MSINFENNSYITPKSKIKSIINNDNLDSKELFNDKNFGNEKSNIISLKNLPSNSNSISKLDIKTQSNKIIETITPKYEEENYVSKIITVNQNKEILGKRNQTPIVENKNVNEKNKEIESFDESIEFDENIKSKNLIYHSLFNKNEFILLTDSNLNNNKRYLLNDAAPSLKQSLQKTLIKKESEIFQSHFKSRIYTNNPSKKDEIDSVVINIFDDNENIHYHLDNITLDYIQELFSCKLCNKIVLDIKNCKLCKNIFCQKCIMNYMEINKYNISQLNCPLCKKGILALNLEENEELIKVYQLIFKNGKLMKEYLNENMIIANGNYNYFHKSNLGLILKKINNDYSKLKVSDLQNMIINLLNFTNPDLKIMDEDYNYNNILYYTSELGNLFNEYINKEDKKNFISIKEALLSNNESKTFIAGVFAKYLKNKGMNVQIISESPFPNYNLKLLDWISTGFISHTKITLSFNYEENYSQTLIESPSQRKAFIEKWRNILYRNLGIPLYKIYFHSLIKGSVFLSFSTEYTLTKSTISEIKESYPELKDITFEILIKGCLIPLDLFDPEWNNLGIGWAPKGEKRGNREYDSPTEEWFGYALNVSNKYESDIWLSMNNSYGEWWVAYHGAGRSSQSDEETKRIIHDITVDDFIAGQNQFYYDVKNSNEESKREYINVGKGLYLTDKIDIALIYSGEVKDEQGIIYNIAFMCRVNPNKVRIPDCQKDNFVVDPNSDCVRAYRILLKRNENQIITKNERNCHIF
jgi:hypothetical protein